MTTMRAPFDEWTAQWNDATPIAPAALREWQMNQAWRIAEGLARDNPFYRARVSLPSERSEQAFRSLPLTHKRDVVDDCSAAPPYGSRTVGEAADLRHIVQTSGTTGNGYEVYALNSSDEAAIFRAEATGFWWAGVRPGTRVLLTLPISVAAAGQWYRGGLNLLGANVLCVGGYSTEVKAEILRTFRAEVIVGTPSYLQKLAAVCESQGSLDDLEVRSLVVAGEGYGIGWARSMEERWGGAKLYEQYGCTERIMGWTCPGGVIRAGRLGVLHVPPELAYWEVIDPSTGEQSADGGYGEVVTTPLQAEASPLLRFATGDLVQFVAAGSCDCGRPVAGIRAGGVRRLDGMLKIKGKNVWPEAFAAAVFSVSGVAEYRGVIRSSDHGEVVEITVDPIGDADSSLPDDVSRAVLAATGLTVRVSIVRPGEITGSVPPGFVKVSRWQDCRSTAVSVTADGGDEELSAPGGN